MCYVVVFFFQAEDGIRDVAVTGVQTCALPISELREPRALPKWLMQVAHHECYRLKRQSRRVVSRDSDEDLSEPEVPAPTEDLVQQTQEEQMLRGAIAALPPPCRRLGGPAFFRSSPVRYAGI